MGAESSTLESINSLNHTLADIERKLGVVEDVHLHHERTICQDDTVLVSGKLIKCNSHVRMVVGPIIGNLGHDYVRILVELDRTSEITFNVFIVDEIATDARFCFEKVVIENNEFCFSPFVTLGYVC